MESLTLKLGGEIGQIDAMALAESLTETVKLLKSVANEEIECNIGDLRVGSAKVVIAAPDREVGIITSGVASLSESTDLPKDWDEQTLDIFLRFESYLSKRGVSSIELGNQGVSFMLDAQIFENSRQARIPNRVGLGSVTGRLYSFSLRNGELKSSLEDARTKKAVKLEVDPVFSNQLQSLLDNDVRVWGLVSRNHSSNEVKKIRVKGIEGIAKRDLPKSTSAFRGALAGMWPADMDPAEAVRAQREA